MKSSVVDDSYAMLFGQLKCQGISRLGTNMIIEENGTTCVIPITRKLGHNT